MAQNLITNTEGIYVDCTVGGGGHAEVILKNLTGRGHLYALDRDQAAVDRAGQRLAPFSGRFTVIHSDYRNLAHVLSRAGVTAIHGALIDLGLSSIQLDDPSRGFAYRMDGPLDLRFDTSAGMSAAEWINSASEEEIARVLHEYGDERHARKIARRVCTARDRLAGGIQTTGQLADCILKAVGAHGVAFGRSAARVFQALRIVVNDELAAIPAALYSAIDLLVDQGRLVVIAYHSGEDRIVKNILREAARECTCPPSLGRCICGANTKGALVQRRAIRPGTEEVAANPRAKAARMRVFERRIPNGSGS